MVAALTPGDGGAAGEAEHAVLVDGASGRQEQTPIPPGDYRQFYARLRDAVQSDGSNPVPPQEAVAVMAVIETAIRSSKEGQAFMLPLTEAERLGFKS